MKKKLLLFVSAFLVGVVSNAQVAKKPLFEEATNASCGPCAAYNPDYNTDLENNYGDVVSIKYQWYFPGTDPMHTQNEDDAVERVAYYGINGVPTYAQNGTIPPETTQAYAGWPGFLTQEVINTLQTETTPISMTLTHTLNNTYDSVFITCEITNESTEEWPAGRKLHVVLEEELITFASAPGSNGETVFENVMRDMYPSNAGTTLGSIAAGNSEVFTFAEALPSYIYDVSQVSIAAFVQDDSDKQVYQSEYSPPYVPDNVFDAALSTSYTSDPCNDMSYTPTVEVANATDNVITEIQVSYKLDGGSPVVETATGLNLANGETTTITFPTITGSGNYSVEFFVDKINGTEADFNGGNNGGSFDISILTSINENQVVVEVTPDNYGSEIAWSIVDENSGAEIFSRDDYSDGNTDTSIDTITLPNESCYKFEITDDYSDGICCDWGNGGYKIQNVSGENIHTGGEYEESDSFTFGYSTGSSTDILAQGLNEFKIYPNPANAEAVIEFSLNNDQDYNVTVSNILGEILNTRFNAQKGYNKFILDVSEYSNGVYFISVASNNDADIKKLFVIK
jgi:hypothetical protein